METPALRAALGEHRLPEGAVDAFRRLLRALEAESDPPTTVRDPAAALTAHLADSLTGLASTEVREAKRLGDIGSGAGFPGLALAIALPRAQVDLIDSVRRKGEVVDRLIAAAAVDNARSVWSRVENWAAGEGSEAYDVVTARAVGPLPVVLEYAAPLLRLGGTLVVWRGARDSAKERAADAAAAELGMSDGTVQRVTPFEGADNRHLYLYSKVGATPDRFPRRAGLAAKRPLA